MKHPIKFITLAICFSITANAQNIKEAVQNTKQIQEGKRNLERDIKELHNFTTKLDLFDSAFNNKEAGEVNKLKASLVIDMIREVKQSGEKAKKARLEVAQSSSEIRSDRREIRDNKEDSKRGRFDRRDDKRDNARDQANKRDDQRDRRDDIGDLKQQIARAERQTSILKAIKDYHFNFDNQDASIENKNFVLAFAASMKQDIEATKTELAEDMREQREDSRERRDDRNERNEKEVKKRRRF